MRNTSASLQRAATSAAVSICRLELALMRMFASNSESVFTAGPGKEFGGDIGGQCRLAGELARQAHARGECLKVGPRLQEVELDRRGASGSGL